jgi:thiosulfate dehydrogenase
MIAAPLLSLALVFAAPAGAAPPDRALVERGAYVARLADCVGCHTAEGGAPLAGGRALWTPFGTIRSANLTPDVATGIGAYSFEQFERAVRHGVRADGANLYPAMPYPSFTRATDEDVRALYAWAVAGVAPVERRNAAPKLRWPFGKRWGLAPWRWAFLDEVRFEPDPGRDAAWNRGAYLVQALGHCGACHTPRGVGFQEKATSERGSSGGAFLAGATLADWRAVSLREPRSAAELVSSLRTGRSGSGAVSGSMVEVIHASTQHFTDADRAAVATYLASLAGGEPGATPAQPATAAAPEGLFTTRGGLGYVQFCASCHRQDGSGVDGLFPPLAGNPTVRAPDPATLVHLALAGGKTAETAAAPRVHAMPGYPPLADRELAEILGFVRATWGDGRPVDASAVAELRARIGPGPAAPPGFETPRFADLLGRPDSERLVYGLRLHLDTSALLAAYVGAASSCSSCHLNAGTVALGSPFVGVAAFFPGYAPRAGREITLEDRINGCFRRSMNGRPLPAGSAELKAMVAYFEWMRGSATARSTVAGRGVGKMAALPPDPVHGAQVYAAECAACHGERGEGLRGRGGRIVYPPLWGDAAFNLGAGMARTYTAAAFVKANMPIAARDRFPLAQGGLSDQDAVDVAEYFSHQPRPDFPDKVKDWPKGGKPPDARY